MTGKSTIFLVDDDATFVHYARRFVETDDRFVVVGSAADMEQALHVIPALQPDAVLLDLSLRDQEDLDAIRDILAVSPEAAVIVVTSREPAVYRDACLERGARGFVAKMAITEDLLPAIHEAIAT